MKKSTKVLFRIEFITGILLIIGGAILFIGLPDKTAAHCLLIAGLVQPRR